MFTKLSDKAFRSQVGALQKQTEKRDATALNLLLNCVYHVYQGNKNPLTDLYGALQDNPDAFPRGFARAFRYQFTDPRSNTGKPWITTRRNKDKTTTISIAGWQQHDARIKFGSDGSVMCGKTPVTCLGDLMPPTVEKQRTIKPLDYAAKFAETITGGDVAIEGLTIAQATAFASELNELINRYGRKAKANETIPTNTKAAGGKAKRNKTRKVKKAETVEPMQEQETVAA